MVSVILDSDPLHPERKRKKETQIVVRARFLEPQRKAENFSYRLISRTLEKNQMSWYHLIE